MSWRRHNVEVAEFIDPCRCFKDDVSSGPSPTDPGIGGLISGAGGGDTSAFTPPAIAGNAGFAAPSPPTGASSIASAPSVPQLFGISSSFGGGDPGAGVPNTGGIGSPSTASIGTPGGLTTSAAPSASAPVSPLGAPGVGAPTDLSSAFYDPNNPSSSPFASGGAAPATALTQPQLGAPAVTPSSPANATAGGTATNNSPSVLDSLGIKNPLGAAVGAAGLGYAALENKAPKFSPQLEAQAASLNANGQQLMSYLQSGSLPPGLQASLTQATSAAKAKIISNFAAQGLNTDPSQNSALASELAADDQQALISTAQIGQQLMQSGITESGLSSDLYKTLAQIDQTQTANIGKAIANFASAVSGGGGNSLTDALAKKLSS